MELLKYIVKRLNGDLKFGAPEFYWWVKETLPTEEAEPILAAIDTGDNWKVQQAIFEHFDSHKELRPLALAYMRAVSWVDDDVEESTNVRMSLFVPLRSTETDRDEYHEVEYEYPAPKSLTTRRQVMQGLEIALKAGWRPWRTLSFEWPLGEGCGVDYVLIRMASAEQRKQLEAMYMEHEKQQPDDLDKWQPIDLKDLEYEIQVNVVNPDNGEQKRYWIKKRVNLKLTQPPIYYAGREYYGME